MLISQVACRTTCVDSGAGAAATEGSGRTLLGFFKPKSATDGAEESPVLMDGSNGGGASGDADVVTTGVVSRSEGVAGAGSFADAVATGFVNGLEDCEGSGIDMDGVFSDAADGSGPADRTLVHAPIDLLRGITSGCPGACSRTLPINFPRYSGPGGVVGGSD